MIVHSPNTAPVLHDAVIDSLQQTLDLSVSWLEQIYPLAEVGERMDNEKIIRYPRVYTGEGLNYVSLFPDDTKEAYCFFEIPSGQYAIDNTELEDEVVLELALVVWANLKLVDDTKTWDFRDQLIKEVTNALRQSEYSEFLVIQDVIIDRERIFENYSFSFQELKYIMYPYTAFKVVFEVRVDSNVECEATNADLLTRYNFCLEAVQNRLTDEQVACLTTWLCSCEVATITINTTPFDTVASGGTLDIDVLNTALAAVGSNISGNWIIGNSTIKRSDLTTIATVAAEGNYTVADTLVKNSENTLIATALASGADVVITDSAIRRSDATLIANVAAEQPYTVADTLIKNSLNTTIGTALAAGANVPIANSAVTVNSTLYLNVPATVPLTIPVKNTAGTNVGTVNAGVDVVVPDATITINSAAFDTTASGVTENQIVENTAGTQVGSKVGSNWRIGDSTITVNGGAYSSTAATVAKNVDVENTAGTDVGALSAGKWIIPYSPNIDSDGSSAPRAATVGLTCKPFLVVDFSANNLTPTAFSSITFTDATTGTPTSWLWDFGDGTTSTSQNPTKTYNFAGTYTVTLYATKTGANGFKTRTSYITVAHPIPVTNLKLWFRADYGMYEDGGTDLCENGDNIRFAQDYSGQGHFAQQLTGSNQPNYTTGGLNGFPVVSVTGTNNDRLSIRDDDDAFDFGTGNYSIWMVVNSSSGAAFGTFLAKTNIAASVVGMHYYRKNSTNEYVAWTGAERVFGSSSGGAKTLGIIRTGTGANGTKLRYQGAQTLQFTDARTFANTVDVTIGRNSDGEPYTGDIAEIIIYNSDKTADITQIENYLRAKYATW